VAGVACDPINEPPGQSVVLQFTRFVVPKAGFLATRNIRHPIGWQFQTNSDKFEPFVVGDGYISGTVPGAAIPGWTDDVRMQHLWTVCVRHIEWNVVTGVMTFWIVCGHPSCGPPCFATL
jgi:hypothetical protein